MRIEFDPTNPDEAAAVRAMLTAMHPTTPLRLESATGPGITHAGRITLNEKVHSEDGGMTVNLTDGTVTVASDTDSVPDLDSNGEPWDARIHSTPAKTNADGTWRAKRGVKAEEIAAVRAEREQAYDTDITPEGVSQVREKAAEALAGADLEQIDPPAPAQEQSAPPAPNAPVGEQTAPPAPPAPTGQSADPEPVVSTPSVAAPTDGAPSPAPSFLDVMKAITAAQKDGKIDTAKVKELCAAVGAGDSTMGLNGPDKAKARAAFMALFGEVVS